MKKFFKFYKNSVPFDAKNTDFYLVSFPRSSNTWTRFLIADAISMSLGLNIKVDGNNLNHFVTDSPRNKKSSMVTYKRKSKKMVVKE
jgi:hypothetical protein